MAEHDPYRLPPDRSNPYAPPEADLGPGPHFMPTLTGGGRFSASEVIGQAWEIYKARFGIVIGVVVAGLVINIAYQVVGEEMASTVDRQSIMGIIADLMFRISAVVVRIWITAGQSIALLKVARGDEARITDLFQGGPYVLRIFLASLVFGLAFVGLVLGSMVPGLLVLFLSGQGPGSAIAVVLLVIGFVVGFVLAFMLSVRFYQFTYLIIDREAGVMSSLKMSYEITRGHTLELIGLTLIAGIISASGVLACVVGLLFTIPLGLLMFACIYNALVGGPTGPFVPKSADDRDFPEFTP
jgi:hypothetical protein